MILSVNNHNNDALFLEIINEGSKNIFINTIYRQLLKNKEYFENYFGKFLEKKKKQGKISS